LIIHSACVHQYSERVRLHRCWTWN